MLSRKECQIALKKWQSSKRIVNEVLRLIPANYVVKISPKDINWLKQHNQVDRFHAYMGVHDNKAVMMFFPLDSSGKEIRLNEHAYSFLERLDSEIKFVEQEVKTLTKIAVLSPDIQVISRVVKESVPLFQHNIDCQDTILVEIEDWRNDSPDWFYKQIHEYKGETIFNVFNVPIEDLSDGSTEVIGLFAFKYSKIYTEVIPTIIFVQDESCLLENNKVHSIQTNLYNWSQPCPPFCRPKDDYLLLQD